MDMKHFDIPRVKYLVMKTQGTFKYELQTSFCYSIIYSPHKWRVAHVWSVQYNRAW